MKTTINSRFAEIIHKLYKGNKRAFAHAIDVSPTVIENVVGTRQGKPSYDVIEKVCANANVLPEWLLTGNGPMLRSEEPPHVPDPSALERENAFLKKMVTEKDDKIDKLNRRIGALEERLGEQPGAASTRFYATKSDVPGVSGAPDDPYVKPPAAKTEVRPRK